MMKNSPTIIDLSVAIDPKDWEPEPAKRIIIDHQKGADILGKSYLYFKTSNKIDRLLKQIKGLFGQRIDRRDFPDDMGLSLMIYKLTTHTGTHVDAPYHYGWHSNAQKPPRTVTDIPLSWCYADGVLLDFSNEPDDLPSIQPEAIQKRLAEIHYTLKEGDIVLIATGADKKIGTREYFTHYRAISKEAVAWLVERGIRIIGMDTFSFDPPFCQMLDEYIHTGEKSYLWPAHFYGRDHEYLQIERLCNLKALPAPFGFKVSCFPIKLKEADAAWSRVVAIFDDVKSAIKPLSNRQGTEIG